MTLFKHDGLVLAAAAAVCGACAAAAADGLPGAHAPEPVPLWAEGQPLESYTNATQESVDAAGHITAVSRPAIGIYLPPPGRRNGMALIVCPGGGYRSLDWVTHVTYVAAYLNPKGVAVIGLKYRTSPPLALPREHIQAVTLLDAQRAVRLVRCRASEWGIDPRRIGMAGYSAGANLAMNLAGHFDAGRPEAVDPVERVSCRPDFVVGIATWHWREKASPFTFRPDTPPVFLVHAANDGLSGGAPVELPQAIRRQLEAIGIPVNLIVFEDGAHGVGNLIPQRVGKGFPGTTWPDRLLAWLDRLPPPANTP